MSAEPLTAQTGMLRSDIETKLDLEVTKSREALRAEVRGELAVIQKNIEVIQARQTEQGHDIRNLRQGQIDMQTSQAEMRSGLAEMRLAFESSRTENNRANAAILDQLKELKVETTTITEETAEGRTVTRHFRSWRSVGQDLKKFWPHIVAAWFAYHTVGGWLTERGITWAMIWAPHHAAR